MVTRTRRKVDMKPILLDRIEAHWFMGPTDLEDRDQVRAVLALLPAADLFELAELVGRVSAEAQAKARGLAGA